MTPFDYLKPGDKVVYYQTAGEDTWPYAGVGTVRTHVDGYIVLEEIAGWTFRTSDGNPVGYDEHPQLCTYIAPTTPGLIDRVTGQRERVERYRKMREDLGRTDWYRIHAHVIQRMHDLLPKAEPYVCYTKSPIL